jgi:hypothetical protein
MIKRLMIVCALIAASQSLLPQKSVAQTQAPAMQEADALYVRKK